MVPGFLLDLVVRPSKRQEREWSMTSKVIIPDWLCHGRDNWCSKGGHLTWLSSSNLWWLSCPCPFKPIGSFRDADISFKFPHCPKHFPMPGLLPLVPLGICFPHVILFCVFWWRLINLLLTSLMFGIHLLYWQKKRQTQGQDQTQEPESAHKGEPTVHQRQTQNLRL